MLALLMTGCLFTTKPKYKYPSDMNQMCVTARSETQSWLQANKPNLKLRPKASVTVVKVPGETIINGIWSYADPRWPDWWIGGSCSGSLIKIACNPITGGDVNYGVLKHEFGHFWLFPAGIYGHPKGFEGLFGFYGEAPFDTSKREDEGDDVCISISYTKDGVRHHIDVLKKK